MKSNFLNLKPWSLVALALAGVFSVAAQETNRVDPNDFSAFRIITERNIFDPNRRPQLAPQPAPKIVDSFALVGTMSYDKGPFAVFDGNSSDYHKVLETGGKIAGYTVTNINENGVTLVAGTNEVVLQVGTQMRRNEAGDWSVAGAAEWTGHSYAASNAGSDRRTRYSPRRPSRRRSPNNFSPADTQTGGVPGMTEPPPGGAQDMNPGGPPEDANLDPVARMMARRAREERGSRESNGNDNTNSDQ